MPRWAASSGANAASSAGLVEEPQARSTAGRRVKELAQLGRDPLAGEVAPTSRRRPRIAASVAGSIVEAERRREADRAEHPQRVLLEPDAAGRRRRG